MIDGGAARRDLHRAFGLAVAIISVCLSLGSLQADDGLRHVGLAFGPSRAWGEVYPFSYFQVFSSYGPWAGYDASLRVLARGLGLLPIPVALQRFIALKLLSAAFVAALLGLCLRRSGIASVVRDGRALLLALALTAAWLVEPMTRLLLCRPFAFGSFLLVYCVGRRGALRGALASSVPLFMYPYLGFIYTVPVAIAHALRGSRAFAAGGLGVTAVFVALQPRAFFELFAALLRSDRLRARMPRFSISELTPLSQHPALVLAVVLGLLLVLPRARAPRRLGVEQVLMLLYAPVALKYVRYFVDVELCLLFVAYGADALLVLERGLSRVGGEWRRVLGASPAPGPEADSRRDPLWLRPTLVFGYAALSVLLALGCIGQYRELGRAGRLLASVPEGALVLTRFSEQYPILYDRPDLALVPSCEVGFPVPAIERPYLDFFNLGRVCTLAKAVGARYLVESRRDYLDPMDTHCLDLLRDDSVLRLWRID